MAPDDQIGIVPHEEQGGRPPQTEQQGGRAQAEQQGRPLQGRRWPPSRNPNLRVASASIPVEKLEGSGLPNPGVIHKPGDLHNAEMLHDQPNEYGSPSSGKRSFGDFGQDSGGEDSESLFTSVAPEGLTSNIYADRLDGSAWAYDAAGDNLHEHVTSRVVSYGAEVAAPIDGVVTKPSKIFISQDTTHEGQKLNSGFEVIAVPDGSPGERQKFKVESIHQDPSNSQSYIGSFVGNDAKVHTAAFGAAGLTAIDGKTVATTFSERDIDNLVRQHHHMGAMTAQAGDHKTEWSRDGNSLNVVRKDGRTGEITRFKQRGLQQMGDIEIIHGNKGTNAITDEELSRAAHTVNKNVALPADLQKETVLFAKTSAGKLASTAEHDLKSVVQDAKGIEATIMRENSTKMAASAFKP